MNFLAVSATTVLLSLPLVAVAILMHAKRPAPQVVDMQGKVVIVTGGNAGIGLGTAKALAEQGATVIIACRDQIKSKTAIEMIERSLEASQKFPGGKLLSIPLDLASTKSIKQFVQQFKDLHLPLHVLVNNAAVIVPKTGAVTHEGHEMHFGVNYLGHFFLTKELFEVMKNVTDHHVRVVTLTSVAHYNCKKVDWNVYKSDKWRTTVPDFSLFSASAYAYSKLAVVQFSLELQRKLQKAGLHHISAYCVDPGAVSTGIAKDVKFPIFVKLLKIFVTDIDEGASTSVFCATSPHLPQAEPRGGCYRKCKPFTPSNVATNQDLARELWEVSEQLLGEKFHVSQ